MLRTLGELDPWLGAVKSVLVGCFGTRWSTAWAQAGFTNSTTQIPVRVADCLTLAGRLAAFFTASPSYEVPSMLATAAQGNLLQGAALAAKAALAKATRTQGTVGQTWTEAFTALTDEMWSLVKILQATLNDDDTRWLAFGLPMPATPSTPGKPANVSAQLDASGAILAQCDAEALATRYRARMMILGVDGDYVLAASGKSPLLSIPGVEPGRTVQIIMQAVNGNLQGVASDPVVFTVPVAAPSVAAVIPPVKGVDVGAFAHSPNGNGHRNGTEAHARAV